MYALGKGVNRDADKAMEWFRIAAEKGDAEAQYRLGGMYDVGHINNQDPATAIKWYTLSANQHYRDAEYRLGVMYELGRGVQAPTTSQPPGGTSSRLKLVVPRPRQRVDCSTSKARADCPRITN